MRGALLIRLGAVIALACVACLSLLGPSATAATVDVVVDSTDVPLTSADDGKQTGKVTVANISTGLVTLDATRPGDAGCSITASPTSVSSGRRTQVTLTLGQGCDVEGGADVRLAFGAGVTPPSYDLKVSQAKKDPHWAILWYALFIGAGAALAAVVAVGVRIVIHNIRRKEGEARLGWRTALKHLGTSWSFKDNWVGNVTIGSAALVALLASSNVLTAVLGAKPEAAVGLLAVASALAAVFVSIGPLLVKVIGDDMAVPTIGGMLVAGFVTLVGTLGQISALTWQGAELASGAVEIGVVVLGILVGALVWSYGTRALWAFAKTGSTEPPKKDSDAVTAAKHVARAIDDLGGPRPRVPEPEGAEPDSGARAEGAEPVEPSLAGRSALL